MKYAIKYYDKLLAKIGFVDSIYDRDLLEFDSFSDAVKHIEENFGKNCQESREISIIRIIDK